MAKHRNSTAGLVLMAFLLVGVSGCSGPSVIPEMKDVIDNFTDRAKRETVLNKYGASGVVPQELTVCDMAKPVISKTEEKEGITYYTLESRVEKCEHSPAGCRHGAHLRHWMEERQDRQVRLGRPQGGKVKYRREFEARVFLA